MASDVEGSNYNIGTTSIRLVRVGNLVQVMFSNSWEAKYLYQELAEKYKQAEGEFKKR